MGEQILKTVSGFIRNLLLLLIACQANLIVASDELEFEELLDIAERYDCPQPPQSSELIVGWSGSWRTIGRSNSKHAGIYRPGFVMNKDSKEEVEVLMGFAKVICKSRKTIPATREFILSSPDEVGDGYTVLHNHLSSFETCIQLARMGRTELANKLWAKFSKSSYITGGHAHENIPRLVSNPKLLLARSIFEYNKNKTLQPGSDWKDILKTLEKLRDEFPELFSSVRQDYNAYYRNQFVDDLKITVATKHPENGTVEESLLAWAMTTGEMRHLGFYDSHNLTADAPVREIFNRGIESLKPLVELVDDRRLTLHIRQAQGNAREYRLRVGDLAKMLLREMSGAKSPVKNGWTREKSDVWLDWIANTDLSDEGRFFELAAFNLISGKAHQVPIRILDIRHPKTFVRLVETITKNAQPTTYCHYITYTIRDSAMPVAEKSKLLSLMSRQLPGNQKRSAVQALAQVNKNLTAELVMPLIEQHPRDVDEPYWTSEAANLTHVVMYLDDIEVWKTYLQKAKNAAVGLRMEMMEPMNYSYISKTNLNFRLAFLSSFLDDETVRKKDADRQKFTGPCAAFTFKEISVRNYVTIKLASLIVKPEDYPDDSWTPEQWDELRKEVRSQLAKRELPAISHADK